MSTAAVLRNYEATQEQFHATHGMVLDDHDGKVKPFHAIIYFQNPHKGIAGWQAGYRYQCLNLIHMDKETREISLSQMSIGGVLWGREITPESLRDYNESVIFEGGKITKAILVDGTVILPAPERREEDE